MQSQCFKSMVIVGGQKIPCREIKSPLYLLSNWSVSENTLLFLALNPPDMDSLDLFPNPSDVDSLHVISQHKMLMHQMSSCVYQFALYPLDKSN